ncbi:cytoplasmic protein NCK1-like protein [Dinothrombium tinctorium]|uniref:Cytoplasmic protein NCK1-like protein n=1 Tax=Dinothrombium tinctorium TaxID=1965070 RepID=A0A443RMN0_9ACAR|nr:cytoplasmic protein NCK1-like protein [Dinothrombium tinctorium]
MSEWQLRCASRVAEGECRAGHDTGKSGEEVFVIAKYDYTAQGSQELDLKKNERLTLLDDSKHWWKVLNSKNVSGFVPSNYVKKEKPSIFDSIRKKVRKRTDSKGSCSPISSPVAAKTVDININGSPKARSPLDEVSGAVGFNCSPIAKSIAYVKYNYEAQQPDELSLVKGSTVVVLEKSSDGWWKGEVNDIVGWFPSNYVQEDTHRELCGSSKVDTPNENVRIDLEASSSARTNIKNGFSLPKCHKLETVIALYSFVSQNEEELSFQKGERLEILDKPLNDPDWWLARNSEGLTGLVPKNYVAKDDNNLDTSQVGNTQKELSKLVLESESPITKHKHSRMPKEKTSVSNQPWYFGSISRNQCDQLLNEIGDDGDFLIRDSETNAGDYSVSLKAPGRNKHFRVHFDNGIYCIGQRRFTSLDELIDHYKKAPIYTSPKGEKMYLIKALTRPQL